MSEDIKFTEGTILESLNDKVDLDGGNYRGSRLEELIKSNVKEKRLSFSTDLKSAIKKSKSSQTKWIHILIDRNKFSFLH